MAKTRLDILREVATQYGVPCNYNARVTQGDTDFGSLLTWANHQPSYADLNLSRDTRHEHTYLFGIPLNSLPKKRKVVIFKISIQSGNIYLNANPECLDMVRLIAAEAGVRVGKVIDNSWQCWESFGIGWADPREL